VSNLVVGVTGGIGSGKSTVARLFAEYGASIVDTDDIAHRLTAPGGAALPAIVEQFGPQILAADGALDRAAMRQRVFADTGARRALEAILHPLIGHHADIECTRAAAPYVLLLVPLLVETGTFLAKVSRVLVVDCDESTQIDRVVRRNGLSEAEVRAIMATQASRAERLAVADDVVRNEGDLATVREAVRALHDKYLTLGRELKETC
jgi:dephospho-CoA kinase